MNQKLSVNPEIKRIPIAGETWRSGPIGGYFKIKSTGSVMVCYTANDGTGIEHVERIKDFISTNSFLRSRS